jgi:hypothetical protein
VIYVDRYEELASRTNVLFAWNSLKTVQSSGIATSLQLDGQGLSGVRPNLNLPSNPSNRPLVVTDSSHRGYPVLFAQGTNQRHLYANTTYFTGVQLAVFLFNVSPERSFFFGTLPIWGIRTFEGSLFGQQYEFRPGDTRSDNVLNGECYYRDTSGNIVSSTIDYTEQKVPFPVNQWVLGVIHYNIPITVANFALFGFGELPRATDTYLSIGFILNSSNWSDRTDFVDYLKLFL